MNRNQSKGLSYILIILLLFIIAVTIIIGSYAYFNFLRRIVIEKNKLTITWTEDAQTLDPIIANDPRSIELILNIYDRLIDYEEKEIDLGKKIVSTRIFKPALAESWKILENGKIYIFHLRKDVKFHNGDPVTAKAVKYSITTSLLKNPTIKENIMEIKNIDNYTVLIRLNKPSNLFLHYLCHYSTSIINPNQVKEARGIITIDIGSGPYRLVSWEKDDEIILEAVEKHYLKPKIKRIEIKIVKKITAIEAMIKIGETLGPVTIPKKDIELMKKDPNLKAMEFEAYSDVTYLVLNCKLFPLNITTVRQALAWATPIEKIIEITIGEYVKPARSIISENTLGHDPNAWKYQYNITKAKKLLAEAGFKNGFILVAYIPPGKRHFIHILAILQKVWSEIGVDLRIREISESYYQRLLDKEWIPITIYEWSSTIPEPTYKLIQILYSKGEKNYAYYTNSKVDELILKLQYTIEPNKKEEILKTIQQVMVEEVPYIPLYYPKSIIFIRKNLEGYVYYPDKTTRYWLLKVVDDQL